ncbi:hypothetical protein HEP84_06480 [Streptomyces sp. RLB1-33]|uniref:hypothetical protein n=1 Tax=Streptomyces mirabilis TaxID=68239 RepID=UPI002001DF3F|nr:MULTISPECIES: hypothetical protein [Streptomyces]
MPSRPMRATRLFFTGGGQIISRTSYHRDWHETRALALPPALTNTPLAKQHPYDLRHSALPKGMAQLRVAILA